MLLRQHSSPNWFSNSAARLSSCRLSKTSSNRALFIFDSILGEGPSQFPFMTEYRQYILLTPTLDSLWSRTFSPCSSAFSTLYQSFLFSIEFFLVLRWMRRRHISKPVVIFVDVVFLKKKKILEKIEVKNGK